ncbi:MAG: glycosyltransferase 87 family protein [Propionibacteriaceae bacterium]|nr:glycosyltransferase 87 family protein [Propionibacteriaceae bacterium]
MSRANTDSQIRPFARAAGLEPWLAPKRLALVTLAAFVVGYSILCIRQTVCLAGGWVGKNCYSDIWALYFNRGIQDGQIPFIDSSLEYPVLTGAIIELARRIILLFGFKTAPGLETADVMAAATAFFWVTAGLLLVCFLVLLWAHLKLARPIGAVMIAISPALFLGGLINWDALVLMFTSLAFLAWSKKHPAWAGVCVGLGIAAKLYPALLLIPLAVLCLRAGKWRAYFTTCAATAASWLAVNLPVYLLNPAGWLEFWTFNVDRGPDLGSIWYVLSRSGIPIVNLSLIEAVLLVIGTGLICALLFFAPRRPRWVQGAFLLVTWFVIVNKVYSPQYMLWLLPLLVLARPRWLDWAIFSVAESCYFFAIWRHLALVTNEGWEVPDSIYAYAVVLRIAVQLWLCGRVIADICRPKRDIALIPNAAGLLEDPDAGILANAPDARWLQTLRSRLFGERLA